MTTVASGGWRVARKITLLLAILFAFTLRAYGQAANVYITVFGAGAKTGVDLADAAPIGFIQVPGNCGTGGTQIGSDTHIVLSGNFTYASGTNAAIVPKCSGSSGHPVIITTDPGTRPIIISSPSFSYGVGSSPCCGMSLHGLNNVTVDGGVPCGTTAGAVDSTNSCGLVIEDTASGTAYDAASTGGGTIDQSGIFDAGSGTGIEVKNVALLNSYVHLPPWQISSVSFSGSVGTITCSTACPVGNGKRLVIIGNSAVPSTTKLTTTANNAGGTTITVSGGPSSGSASGGWAIDVWGTNPQSNFYAFSFGGNGPGLKFHDSIAAHGGWLIQTSQVATTAPQIYNNQIFDFDHGIAAGVCSAGGCGDGVSFPGPQIWNNHFHDSFNWDDLFDPANRNLNDGSAQGPNNNHHDPIHLQIDLATSNQRYYTSPLIYNNRIDGDPGVDTNNYFFLRASTTNEAVFNNVLGCTTPRPIGADIGVGDATYVQSFTQNPLFTNNTLFCTGNYASPTSATGGNGNSSTWGTSGEQFFNNIVEGLHFDFNVVTTGGVWKTAAGGMDYDVYGDVHGDGGGVNFVANSFGFSGNTIASWQGFLGSGGTNCGGCSPMGTGSPWPVTQGQEAHGKLANAATLNLAADGTPGAGSPEVGAGLNLTSLCTRNLVPLCADQKGHARPTTGAWDIGAVNFAASVVLPPVSSRTLQ
jgi:hypothetical protein